MVSTASLTPYLSFFVLFSVGLVGSFSVILSLYFLFLCLIVYSYVLSAPFCSLFYTPLFCFLSYLGLFWVSGIVDQTKITYELWVELENVNWARTGK